jgi:hypothetical protein
MTPVLTPADSRRVLKSVCLPFVQQGRSWGGGFRARSAKAGSCYLFGVNPAISLYLLGEVVRMLVATVLRFPGRQAALTRLRWNS